MVGQAGGQGARQKKERSSVSNIAEPNKNVIKALEDLLASAKRGEIEGIGVAAVRADGKTVTSYGGLASVSLLGGVSFLRALIEGTLLE